MSSELDVVFKYLFDGMVPPSWQGTYPSIKPLAGWAIDLVARIQQLTEWVTQVHPVLLWIGGLTFPTGYLTALLQATAPKNNHAIDPVIDQEGYRAHAGARVAGPVAVETRAS